MQMDNKRSPGSRRILAQIRRHQSYVAAVVVGVLAFAFLTSGQANATNLLVSWNLSALSYLGFTWYRMMRWNVSRIRQRSADLDFSDVVLLFLSIVAALASIGGIAIELHNVNQAPRDVAFIRTFVAIITILISWVFLHTLFTIHYAHRFYAAPGKGGGLKFPELAGDPIYWDFLYFSFTIGVAAQTADVSITTMDMRRLALLHAVLSFLFNTTILALAINVGASLL